MIENVLAYIANFDTTVLYAVQSVGVGAKPLAMFLSYGLGYKVMAAVFVVALFLIRKYRISLELVIIFFTSGAVIYVLKTLFHVARPYTLDPGIMPFDLDTGYALPSAHAVMSVVILGWMIIKHPKSHFLFWSSVIIILLIGLSRVYLGVHYPSQVIIGWLIGLVLLVIYRYIDKRLWSPFQKKLK